MPNGPVRTSVSLEISPFENGKVLFQKVAPPAKGESARGMLYFVITAENKTTKTLKAKELVVSFPGSPMPSVNLPSRDVEIGPKGRASIALAGSEAIQLSAQAPTRCGL